MGHNKKEGICMDFIERIVNDPIDTVVIKENYISFGYLKR